MHVAARWPWMRRSGDRLVALVSEILRSAAWASRLQRGLPPHRAAVETYAV
jgi:hypothetical protein